MSAGGSFGSSAASPYILANEPTRGATRRAAPGPRGGLPTSPSRRSRVRHSALGVSNTGQRVNTARRLPNRAPGHDSLTSAPGGARPQACQHLTLPHCRTGKQQLETVAHDVRHLQARFGSLIHEPVHFRSQIPLRFGLSASRRVPEKEALGHPVCNARAIHPDSTRGAGLRSGRHRRSPSERAKRRGEF